MMKEKMDKKEMKFKVIEFFDVYRKDIFKKYGAANYDYHDTYKTTETEIQKYFKNEKEAINFAKKEFSNSALYYDNGNIYLKRILVIDSNNEIISDFGISLLQYEELKNINREEGEEE